MGLFGDALGGTLGQRVAGSERAQDGADLLATLEIEQLQAAADLADAADLEHDIRPPDREHRREALLSIIQAMLSGEFTAWWRHEIAGAALDREPAESLTGVGHDSERWEEQLHEWAESIRAQGGSGPDRELADHACREVYGVGVDRFEEMVVEFEEAEAARELIAGNVQAATRVMRDAAEAIEEDSEDA